jgi:SAM-dependent methyltransferase
MRNSHNWKPSKFIKKRNSVFTANTEKKIVGTGYQYLAEIQANHYSGLIQKYARKDLLDLGCGDVPLYEMYKDNVSSVCCCDWGNSYHKAVHLDFIADLNSNLPIKESSFDTVILSDVIEHLITPEKIFLEISRILRQDGILFLSVPFLHALHEEPYDYSRLTEYKLTHLCSVNNLKIIHLESYGGSFELFSLLILIHLARIQPDFMTVIMKKLLLFMSLSKPGRRIYDKTARKFPLGYCLVAQKVKK